MEMFHFDSNAAASPDKRAAHEQRTIRVSPARRTKPAPAAKDFEPHAGNVRAFSTPKAWAAWLRKHHASSPGLWIKYYKKSSGIRSITYAQALDEALCWGWIDGQAKPLDDQAWMQRFTPRR